ncbi:Calx-beta domain-containing protein [Methylomagnum ishizawai]|uniref:Calx-beta domain-containing protein n=1 Tax=Methylomagnum ishizawai TaxID=1760988 RepID=UPI001C33608E|nr:Calx-beta domain-containing protein [Methylomagnum ishizawai]BBL74931.1 hypothetical protein MishRS11D_20290 [Methylomagnum ishizawai]
MKTLTRIAAVLAMAVAHGAAAEAPTTELPWIYTLPDWLLASGIALLFAGASLLCRVAYRRWRPQGATGRLAPLPWAVTGAVVGVLVSWALEEPWQRAVFDKINQLPSSAAGGRAVGLELFSDVADKTARSALAAPREATRTRHVRVDLQGLNAAQLKQGDSLPLNLFNDAAFKATIKQVDKLGPDRTAYVGRLSGIQLSTVNMVVEGDVMMANVVHPGGAYQIRYIGNGLHSIHEIDQSSLPPEGDPLPVTLPETQPKPAQNPARSGISAPSADETSPASDDGSQIDVLVVYDAAAKQAAGGPLAMQALIDLAVSETNTNYANSGINQRVKLAHAEEIVYDETGFDWVNTLYRLTNKTDQYLDNIPVLRDTYNADATVLLVANTAYCGMAWQMSSVSAGFSEYAYALVSQDCATGYYSFGHELGHIMGATHDWFVDTSKNSPYTYNKGYVNTLGRWRTVMAYNNECANSGFNCTRLPYWSNPLKTYNDKPMGVPEGTDTSCQFGNPNNPDCDADDARVLNDTAYTVANFRVSTSCKVSVTPAAPSVQPEGGAGPVLNVAAPSQCAWTVASDSPWLTVSSGASGQGSGTVEYQAEPNPGFVARTAKLTVGADNQAIATLTQAGFSGISVGNVQVAETRATPSYLSFPVTLSAKATQTVTVDYATQDGSATAGSDYVAQSGTLTFLPGQITQTVRVQVLGDSVQEPTETLSLVLSNPSAGYTFKTNPGTGSITNFAVANTFIATAASLTEGPAGTTSYMAFKVTLSVPSTAPTTVDFATQDGTATAGQDYIAQSGTLTFAPNQTTQTVQIAILGDALAEPTETFQLLLSNPVGSYATYTARTPSVAGSILNFVNPTLNVANGAASESYAGNTSTLPFKITLSKAPTQAITVDYATQDGTAVAGQDYVAQSGTLTFEAGQLAQTVLVTVIGDNVTEATETFTLVLGNPSSPYLLKTATATGSIANFANPTVSVSNGAANESYAGTTSTLPFKITLSKAPTQAITIDYATQDGTAVGGQDYVAQSGTLTFEAGQLTQTVLVEVIGDNLTEAAETFTLVLGNPPPPYILRTAVGKGSIVNFINPTLIVANGSVKEGADGTTSFLPFKITLSKAPTEAITVDYATQDGTATAGSDYTATSGTLTFQPGQLTQTLMVPVIGDNVREATETLGLTLGNLSSPSPYILKIASATGSLINDD